MTSSVGIALSTDSTGDAAELLRRADMAMYRVKQHGRNACEFFDPAMDDQAADRLDMVNALRGAVDREELVVHYQPIMGLESGEVRAAEALLRWNRPGRGLVPPLEFIPLAEETGVIVLDRRVGVERGVRGGAALGALGRDGGARDRERLGPAAARPWLRGHRWRRRSRQAASIPPG